MYYTFIFFDIHCEAVSSKSELIICPIIYDREVVICRLCELHQNKIIFESRSKTHHLWYTSNVLCIYVSDL